MLSVLFIYIVINPVKYNVYKVSHVKYMIIFHSQIRGKNSLALSLSLLLSSTTHSNNVLGGLLYNPALPIFKL